MNKSVLRFKLSLKIILGIFINFELFYMLNLIFFIFNNVIYFLILEDITKLEFFFL